MEEEAKLKPCCKEESFHWRKRQTCCQAFQMDCKGTKALILKKGAMMILSSQLTACHFLFATTCNTRLRTRIFHGSSPLIALSIHFAARHTPWVLGSIIPNPPLCLGWMQWDQEAPINPSFPSHLDQRNFQISLFNSSYFLFDGIQDEE